MSVEPPAPPPPPSGSVPPTGPEQPMPPGAPGYPVQFAVDYPDRELDRVSTAFRLLTVIPIAIVLAAVEGVSGQVGGGADTQTYAFGGAGLLFVPVLLMIVFRQKYPRWWFDWNLQLLRFSNRVGAYLALMSDR